MTICCALGGAFDGLFADPDTPTDPAIVVDAIADLIPWSRARGRH